MKQNTKGKMPDVQGAVQKCRKSAKSLNEVEEEARINNLSTKDVLCGEELRCFVDAFMKKNFTGRCAKKLNFWDVKELHRPEVLQAIGENPTKRFSLSKIISRLTPSSRFAFWKCVLENRNRIPLNEVLEVWYDCLDERGSLGYQVVSTEHGDEKYYANVGDAEMQEASPITASLLLDNPIVNYRYCQVKKPGWQLFRYMYGRRHQRLGMPKAMREAIQQDQQAVFVIHNGMGSRALSFSVLAEVIDNAAISIFRYLLENNKITDGIIPMQELCCYLVTQAPDDISIPFLGTLEEFHPGIVQSVKDYFGRNLLWYAVQNKRTGWFHPDCKLTVFLLEHGCDPKNTNQLGFSWQTALDGLSLKRRQQMMQRRYNLEHWWTKASFSLQLRQPLGRLIRQGM